MSTKRHRTRFKIASCSDKRQIDSVPTFVCVSSNLEKAILSPGVSASPILLAPGTRASADAIDIAPQNFRRPEFTSLPNKTMLGNDSRDRSMLANPAVFSANVSNHLQAANELLHHFRQLPHFPGTPAWLRS
jgi:hypothetical protein